MTEHERKLDIFGHTKQIRSHVLQQKRKTARQRLVRSESEKNPRTLNFDDSKR